MDHHTVVQQSVSGESKSVSPFSNPEDFKDTGMREVTLLPVPPTHTHSLLDMCLTSREVLPNFRGESVWTLMEESRFLPALTKDYKHVLTDLCELSFVNASDAW